MRSRAPDTAAIERYIEVARNLTGIATATADGGVQFVRELITELKIPPLGAFGVAREHAAELAEKAAKSSSMKANPISLTMEELTETLIRAL